ncbi:hypothetical protein NSU_1497 [Novosphingobium pentaromativorans US6-1]|uniref:Uncharacterized protein n=1 Tax=Novosphingobium pentaromativorans US6-1 TaxID=1088721 RepID=G6EAV0_9SPHN|nr:hypothetical protein NSU_1497 [Novosphingobium pentaromativorans US6-1]
MPCSNPRRSRTAFSRTGAGTSLDISANGRPGRHAERRCPFPMGNANRGQNSDVQLQNA